MAKVILICGKICSGKTYYTKKLKSEGNYVVLSCDELMFDLDLDKLLGYLDDVHKVIIPKLKAYFLKKTVEFVNSGLNVILDFGFWSSSERKYVSNYFSEHGIRYEWHYVNVSDEDWKYNIAERNKKCIEDGINAYLVDEGLLRKFENEFEAPLHEEIDVWINNVR